MPQNSPSECLRKRGKCTLWDQLLGTFHFEEREPFVSDDLGIGAEPEYPVDYWPQLVEPFRAKRTSDYESPA